jgi:hypothetical protein
MLAGRPGPPGELLEKRPHCPQKQTNLDASQEVVSYYLCWEVVRLILVYCSRWTGSKTFH